jgi:hypothetical protein
MVVLAGDFKTEDLLHPKVVGSSWRRVGPSEAQQQSSLSGAVRGNFIARVSHGFLSEKRKLRIAGPLLYSLMSQASPCCCCERRSPQ